MRELNTTVIAPAIHTRVGSARVGGVNSVLPYPCQELILLLVNLGPDLTVQKIENLVADARSDEPARTSEHNGKSSEGEERVEGHLADQRVGDTRGQEAGTHDKTTNTSDSGEEDLDTAAAQA